MATFRSARSSAALTRGGYDGDYEVELMGEEIENSCYQELLEQSKGAFAGIMARLILGPMVGSGTSLKSW